MGLAPLSHSEIHAFASIEGLTPIECRCLRSMSVHFLKGIEAGADDFSMPPWREPGNGFWSE